MQYVFYPVKLSSFAEKIDARQKYLRGDPNKLVGQAPLDQQSQTLFWKVLAIQTS